MTRGGFRKNAKRPLKFGEETVRMTIQVPLSKKDIIKNRIEGILKKYIVKNKRHK